MAMLDGETLRKLLKLKKPRNFVKACNAMGRHPKLDIDAIVETYSRYWDVVRECERVLSQMNMYIAAMPKFLPKTSVEILKSGIARPADWWRVMARDGQIVNPEDPTMEVAAWDGCEPDANCNCSVMFPVKWLHMTNDELGEIFKKGMEK